MAAPLIFGGDISRLDDFTLNLLCNDEVIEVDQDPLGKPGRRMAKCGTRRSGLARWKTAVWRWGCSIVTKWRPRLLPSGLTWDWGSSVLAIFGGRRIWARSTAGFPRQYQGKASSWSAFGRRGNKIAIPSLPPIVADKTEGTDAEEGEDGKLGNGPGVDAAFAGFGMLRVGDSNCDPPSVPNGTGRPSIRRAEEHVLREPSKCSNPKLIQSARFRGGPMVARVGIDLDSIQPGKDLDPATAGGNLHFIGG